MSKTSRIKANTRTHANSAEIDFALAVRLDDEEVPDAVALAIAAQWQSPGTVGHVLAELASTGSADADELLEDISATAREAGGWERMNAADSEQLGLLATWAINHPSRERG